MKWKSLAVYVLCCFLFCNSVLADFEPAVTGSDVGSGSALGSVSVSSDSGSDSAVSDVAPSEPAEPFEPCVSVEGFDEDFSVGEKVDEIVDKLPSLGEPSVPEDSPCELPAEISPGGNTVYVVGDVMNDVGVAPFDPVLTNVVVATGLAPVTPSDTSGVKAVLLSFIGNYDPPIVQYEYTTSNNYKQYVNEIQPDYVWICSFALIALFIYCLFKLGGGLLRG
nr:MAG: hypothetical protein [Inoviridae sp.]